MPTLVEKLTAGETRSRVVRACEDLVAAEVASKGGLGGMAIKAGYKVVTAVKPGVVAELIDKLLPEFAEALEPLHADSLRRAADGKQSPSEAFASHLTTHDADAAEALLSVTDRRARTAKHQALKKTYERLRGTAHEHVRAAVPGLAKAVAPFV